MTDTADNAPGNALSSAKRIVIKIGSSLLVDAATGVLRTTWLAALADDIAKLRAGGASVIIVSSGAIALGAKTLGLSGRPDRLEEAQAAAAIGQLKLAGAYEAIFSSDEIAVAQLLLTIGDLESRSRYLNARNTVEALLARGIMPVINENDTVATGEIRFGDNDRLAARVSHLCGADIVVLLSDIDGLYDKDPRHHADAELVPLVADITPDITAMAGPAASQGPGTGGMTTKILAAEIATDGGSTVILCNGTDPHPLSALLAGGRASMFPAKLSPLAVRKRWIRGLMSPSGFMHLDDGAVQAIEKGASLLAPGLVRVDGDFDRGDLVALCNSRGEAFAQGLVSYNSQEAAKICGCQMHQVADILGYSGRSVLMHRDDMILL